MYQSVCMVDLQSAVALIHKLGVEVSLQREKHC